MNLQSENINPNLLNGMAETYGVDLLEKGGEGSKGGKVIGHTKSGRPIYSHKSNYPHKESLGYV
jgi:hypothetical protein